MLRVASKPPCVCSPDDVAALKALVLEGGEVDPNGLRRRIARAERLAFAFFDHNLAGVGALKHPNTAYRASVFAKSNSSRAPSAFPLELGWVCVKSEYRGRGISGLLLQELMATVRDRNVFATSRTDNTVMHRSLNHSGFLREGTAYASGVRACKLQLFVRVAAPNKALRGARRERHTPELCR